MIIHHTTLMRVVANAALRLKAEGKDYDQLHYLFLELEKMSEQAEAHDAKIRELLDFDKPLPGAEDDKT